MKRKYWDRILIFIAIFMVFLEFVRIGNSTPNSDTDASSVTTYSKNKNKVVVFPVKVTKVSSDDDGNFIIKGTTKAPNGSKVLAWIPGDDHINSGQDQYEDKYSIVRNHKFVVALEAQKASDKEKIKAGDKGMAKLFAVLHYNESFEDGFITHDLQKAIENIKVSKLTYNKQLVNYLKD